jgi:Carboxypeptidase regulatory-like domain
MFSFLCAVAHKPLLAGMRRGQERDGARVSSKVSLVKRVGIIIAIATTTALTLVPAKPSPQYRITGKVSDENGAVLPNAMVTIQHWEYLPNGKSLLRQDCRVEADRSGKFSCPTTAGIYEIFASFPGVHPYANRLKVEKAAPAQIDITLKADRLTTYVN